MAVTSLHPPKKIKKPKKHKKTHPSFPSQTPPPPVYTLPQLPTLDWEWGYKYVTDETSGETKQSRLTLLDILYPTGEEFYMAESKKHHDLAQYLELLIKSHLNPLNWLILANVFIHWGWPGVSPSAPDIVAISESKPLERDSYYVGQDGVLPEFVVEITSKSTREQDISHKVWHYAAVGVKEYLIVDICPKEKENWHLYGYRLEDEALYQKIEADKEGRLTFKTIGLQFKIVDKEKIDVYNTQTGMRLLTPQEQAKAEAEARQQAEAKAKAETEARQQAEAKIEALTKRLAELEKNS